MTPDCHTLPLVLEITTLEHGFKGPFENIVGTILTRMRKPWRGEAGIWSLEPPRKRNFESNMCKLQNPLNPFEMTGQRSWQPGQEQLSNALTWIHEGSARAWAQQIIRRNDVLVHQWSTEQVEDVALSGVSSNNSKASIRRVHEQACCFVDGDNFPFKFSPTKPGRRVHLMWRIPCLHFHMFKLLRLSSRGSYHLTSSTFVPRSFDSAVISITNSLFDITLHANIIDNGSAQGLKVTAIWLILPVGTCWMFLDSATGADMCNTICRDIQMRPSDSLYRQYMETQGQTNGNVHWCCATSRGRLCWGSKRSSREGIMNELPLMIRVRICINETAVVMKLRRDALLADWSFSQLQDGLWWDTTIFWSCFTRLMWLELNYQMNDHYVGIDLRISCQHT